jgi:SAM-dependent methyltransferase
MSGPPRLFDKRLIATRARRALAAGREDFLFRAVADDLLDRLAAVNRAFGSAIDASPLPHMTDAIRDRGTAADIFRLAGVVDTRPDAVGDPEAFPFPAASLDLVVSALALHLVDDLPGTFAQIRRALRPDGLFLAALPGGDTLTELREALAAAEEETTGGASPRVVPFVEVRTAGALLQRAGFALPVVDRDRRTVRYPSALHLMRDLRAMGAANPLAERSRTPMTRRMLERTIAIYAERFSDPDGRVRATFEIVSLSGWAPHESQQQPLKPGSAKARLADALSATEKSAGEKAGN